MYFNYPPVNILKIFLLHSVVSEKVAHFHSGLFRKEYESFNFISYLCSELYKIEQNKL